MPNRCVAPMDAARRNGTQVSQSIRIGQGGTGGAGAGVRQADQRGAATHGRTLPGTGSRRRKPSMCAGVRALASRAGSSALAHCGGRMQRHMLQRCARRRAGGAGGAYLQQSATRSRRLSIAARSSSVALAAMALCDSANQQGSATGSALKCTRVGNGQAALSRWCVRARACACTRCGDNRRLPAAGAP